VLSLIAGKGSVRSGKAPFGCARAVAAATAAALAKAATVGPTLALGDGICMPRGRPGGSGCSGKGLEAEPCCSKRRSIGP
jgi:hypothetical protein